MTPIVISETCACERNDWERRPGTDGTLIVCRQCGKVGAVDEAPGTISVHRVTLDLCSLCITGAGGQCHTPGCSLWIDAAPDVPVSLAQAGQPRTLSAESLQASRLAGRIDQLIGWAKSGQRPEYPAKAEIYILDAENADRLRDDIIDVIAAELPASLGAIFLTALRQQVQQARKDYYEQAIDHGELSGHEEQEARAFGRVEMCDEMLGWLAAPPAAGEDSR